MQSDVIVIGTGPAGVHAARAILENGKRVVLIDGGYAAPSVLSRTSKDFSDVRRTDDEQWKTFLGEDLSGIPTSGLEGGHGGGMTSGNRSYVTKGTENALPIRSKNAYIVQSLATGGLAAAWGGACAFFDEPTLRAMGLDPREMRDAMENTVRSVGVSGPQNHPGVQPPLPVDHHAARMLKQSAAHANALKRLGVSVTQPHSAVLSEPLNGRSANTLADMDYYTDGGRSIYRPQWTLEEITARGATHEAGFIVDRIEEISGGVRVHGRSVTTNEPRTWEAGRAVLAAGALNSARIAAASLNLFDTPLPVALKPHGYIACIDRASLGRTGPGKRLSLCQLLVTDTTPDVAGIPSGAAQIYSYRSLMLFRLLPALPLPAPLAMRLLALLAPSLVLADMRFPANRNSGHSFMLTRNGTLDITGNPSEWRTHAASHKRLKRALRLAGLTPVRTMRGLPGSSSHYAGTIPISDDPSDPLRCDASGLIHGCTRVHVADAAMFRCLPPLPHTLTLMANAYRVGRIISRMPQ